MERSYLRQVELNDRLDSLRVLEFLRAEFRPLVSLKEYLNDDLQVLGVCLSNFLLDPKHLLKGSDLFVFENLNSVQGVTQAKYYDWDLLKKQIHFAANINQVGQIERVWLAPLSNIVGLRDDDDHAIATELAYYWIDQDVRGNGFGRLLFNAPFDRFVNIRKENYFLFTIAMGNSVGTKRGNKLLEYMLNKEKEVNGLDSNGKVIVKGISVEHEELENIGFTSEMFGIRNESMATKVLALERGLKFVAFSRNLSPLYGARY